MADLTCIMCEEGRQSFRQKQANECALAADRDAAMVDMFLECSGGIMEER